MGEVGEADDHPPADAQQVEEQFLGVVDLLQGLAEHHHVEAVRRVVADLGAEIALEHGQAAFDAAGHFFLGLLDAGAGHLLVGLQVGEQVAVAAAEIEYARARFDPRGDHLQVEAQTARLGVNGSNHGTPGRGSR